MDERKSYIIKMFIEGGRSVDKTFDLAEHGIYFARGGAIELLTLPTTINEVVNDWQEEHGLEIDPRMRIRSCGFINLRFVVVGQTREEYLNRLDFFRSLMDSYFLRLYPAGLRSPLYNMPFHIDRINIESYRHIGKPLYRSGAKAGEVTIRCRLKDLWQKERSETGYTPEPLPLTRVMVGDVDLAKLGIQVQEVYDTLLQPASFKEFTYKRKSRDIAIRCLSIADDYMALAYDLALLGEQITDKQFYLTYGGGSKVRCYYTSMTDLRELMLSSRKGITFTLNFKTT